jgi:hypothetical protein
VKETKIVRARRLVEEQRTWIAEHGGDLSGYIERYGAADAAPGDPRQGGRYGSGGPAIYEADLEALRLYEGDLSRLEKKQR